MGLQNNTMSTDIRTFFHENKERRLLSVFYTAGFPTLDSTLPLAKHLQTAGVDFLEIGIPYSDPVADGPVIQHSSEEALKNGMTVSLLFEQLKNLREDVQIPVFLMGYFNPILQFGVENFCKRCQECGINGVIIPDLPIFEFETQYREMFNAYNLHFIFLVTPQTDESRIRRIDSLSTAFIYALSSAATTGKDLALTNQTETYFQQLKALDLQHPLVVGFGISDLEKFELATNYAAGAIVGSAFVKEIQKEQDFTKIPALIRKFRG